MCFSFKMLKNIAALIMVAVLFQNCAKQYDNSFNSSPLTIDSIVPAFGTAGTAVRVYGKGFAYPAKNNEVNFNGTQAIIDTNTVLGVLLAYAPPNGTTGNISVHAVPFNELDTGPVFTYSSFPVPVITDVEYNGLFEIVGQNFDPTSSVVSIAGQVVSGFTYSDYGNGTGALIKSSYSPPSNSDNPVPVTVTVTVSNVSSSPYSYLFYPQVNVVSPDTVSYKDVVTLQGILFGSQSLPSNVKAYYYDQGQNKVYMSPDPSVVSWNTNTITINMPDYGSYPIGTGVQPFYLEVNVGSKSGVAPVYFHIL
jgi:hypothetical protein